MRVGDSLDVDGRVDAVIDGQVAGWAWVPASPQTRLNVTISVDDQDVAFGVADRERQDLREAGIGDGMCGFLLPLPPEIAAPGAHHLSVRAADDLLPAAEGFIAKTSRSDIPWYGVEFTVALADGPHDEHIDGRVDLIADGTIHGWAWDPTRPAEHVAVTVTAGGHVVASELANLFRGDLETAGIGKGDHGFVLHHDLALDTDSLRVTAGRSGLFLRGSPGPTTQASSVLPGMAIATVTASIGGWSRQAADVGAQFLLVMIPRSEDILGSDDHGNLVSRRGEPILEACDSDPALDPLDLVRPLISGARQEAVFAESDSGLSDWGIFCVHRAIAKRLALGSPEDSRRRNPGGVPAPPPDLQRVVPAHFADVGSAVRAGFERTKTIDLPRIVVIGPTTAEALVRSLASGFRYTLLVSEDAPLGRILALERPDVVLGVVDERSLIVTDAF